jgi:hypothetical protein
MYYTPTQATLILAIILCIGGWMIIGIEDVYNIVMKRGGRLEPGEINNLIWLAVAPAAVLAVYFIFNRI